MGSFELFLSWWNKNMTHKSCSGPSCREVRLQKWALIGSPSIWKMHKYVFPPWRANFHCFNKLYTLDGHQLLSAARNGLKTPRNRNLMAGPHRLVPSPTEDYSRPISASFQRFQRFQLSVLFFEVAQEAPRVICREESQGFPWETASWLVKKPRLLKDDELVPFLKGKVGDVFFFRRFPCFFVIVVLLEVLKSYQQAQLSKNTLKKTHKLFNHLLELFSICSNSPWDFLI